MFDIDKILKENGLTNESYEKMLDDFQKKTFRETDKDWSELAEEWGLSYSGDVCRKASQLPLLSGSFVKQYYDEKMAKNSSLNEDEYLKKLEEKKKEIQKEKIKLQSEKTEYSKWLREDARSELFEEKLFNAIEKLDKFEDPAPVDIIHSNREFLLVFSDAHYGTELEIKDLFGRTINSYSPEIFEERMNYLLYKVIDIVEKENIDVLNIFSLGDELEGILRVSQLMKLRYGVIDAAINYAEYMSNWFNILSNHVNIKVHFVEGNHGEIRHLFGKKGDFPEDNMTKVIVSYIKLRLKDNHNFKIIENPTGYAYAQLCGFTVLGMHGDEVKGSGDNIRKGLSSLYFEINYLIRGHLHHSESETVGIDCEVLTVPSIIGVDDYSLSLNKAANAGASLFVFENGFGKIMEYNIKLN